MVDIRWPSPNLPSAPSLEKKLIFLLGKYNTRILWFQFYIIHIYSFTQFAFWRMRLNKKVFILVTVMKRRYSLSKYSFGGQCWHSPAFIQWVRLLEIEVYFCHLSHSSCISLPRCNILLPSHNFTWKHRNKCKWRCKTFWLNSYKVVVSSDSTKVLYSPCHHDSSPENVIDVLILAILSYYQCRNRTCALFCAEKMSCAVLLPVLIDKRKLLFIIYLTGEDNFGEILNNRRYT